MAQEASLHGMHEAHAAVKIIGTLHAAVGAHLTVVHDNHAQEARFRGIAFQERRASRGSKRHKCFKCAYVFASFKHVIFPVKCNQPHAPAPSPLSTCYTVCVPNLSPQHCMPSPSAQRSKALYPLLHPPPYLLHHQLPQQGRGLGPQCTHTALKGPSLKHWGILKFSQRLHQQCRKG